MDALHQQRHTRGEATHRDILAAAVDIASAEGLEGLSIGRLATELKLSKSGLFAHFGSKEKLQLATLDHASEIFIAEIIVPAEGSSPGIQRLGVLLENWLSYVERIVFRGGCFFAAASLEFDGRPGAVRARVAALTKAWVDLLVAETKEAQARSQVRKNIDPGQLVFEVHAFVQEANWAFQLLESDQAFKQARRAIRDRLEDAATPTGRTRLRQVNTRTSS